MLHYNEVMVKEFSVNMNCDDLFISTERCKFQLNITWWCLTNLSECMVLQKSLLDKFPTEDGDDKKTIFYVIYEELFTKCQF